MVMLVDASCYHVSHNKRNPVFWVSDKTNWAAQPQKMTRGLKFRIKEVEGLYYLCSENEGAVQLHRSAPLFPHDVPHFLCGSCEAKGSSGPSF